MFAAPALQARQSRSGAPPAQPAPAPKVPNRAWSRLVQRDPAAAGKSQSEKYDEYQEAVKAQENFLAGAPYFLHDNRPSTGRGIFDAMYYPPRLEVSVKLRFRFKDSFLSQDLQDKGFGKDDVTWTSSEKDAWRQRFMTEVAAKWNSAAFMLYCTRPYWENLEARVVTHFADINHFEANPDPNSEDRQNNPARLPLESDQYNAKGKLVKAGDVSPHFDLVVYKLPKGETSANSVTSTRVGVGYGSFDSQDLEKQENDGFRRRTAVHEAGHMFGLDDTYQPSDANGNPIEGHVPSHAALAQKELGRGVPAKDDNRIMSRGEKFDLSDAVTFLEAIRRTTGIEDWSLNKPPVRRIPWEPTQFNDGVPHPAGTSADTRVA
jgi:hypothetical protein